MTTEEKTLLALLTLAAVLVPVALGAALDWPMWSWLLLAVVLLGVPGLVARNIQRRVQQEWLLQPDTAALAQVEQRDPAQQTLVADIPLPSGVAGYDFRFSATVYWRSTRGSRMQHANLGALAADAILVRARTITVAEQPDKADFVQHRLAGVLGAVQRDAPSGVEVWADEVRLTLAEADQERLRKLSNVRKDEDLGEHERHHELRKRAYLSDALKSTGSAVVWRLVQKDNDVEDTVRLIGALAQLSAAANDAEVPELFRHLVPTPAPPGQFPSASLGGNPRIPNGSFHTGSGQTNKFAWNGLPAGPFSDIRPVAGRWGALMETLDFGDEQGALLARRFALLIEKAGKPDEAEAIRRHFDAPTTDKGPADLLDPDSELPERLAPDVDPHRREESRRNSPPLGEPERDMQTQPDEQPRSEQLEEPHD